MFYKKTSKHCRCNKKVENTCQINYGNFNTMYNTIPDKKALREEDEKNENWRNQPVFSLPTKIGNWNDVLALKEEKLALIKYKRDHCQLLLQKTKYMYQNLLYNVKLESNAEFVKYNRRYMIKAPYIPNKISFNSDETHKLGLFLSCILTEREIDNVQHFVDSCVVTACSERTACVRNSFEFIACDENRSGLQICYGDEIYIVMPESNTKQRLYVKCETASIENFGGHLPVYLSEDADTYCRFKIFHFTPQMRKDSSGSPFMPGTKIIIKHTATDHNLAVEYKNWIPTFFGPECTIACHTYQDCHRMETSENIWEIVGHEEPNMGLYIRAAKGENIPEELLM